MARDGESTPVTLRRRSRFARPSPSDRVRARGSRIEPVALESECDRGVLDRPDGAKVVGQRVRQRFRLRSTRQIDFVSLGEGASSDCYLLLET